MTVTPLSGTQYELTAGEYRAVIASVGASLRVLQYGGRDLVVPFGADEVRISYRGALLAPWPNRIVDGRYTQGGVTRALPLTEPDRSHALHGLLAWADFTLVEQASDEVTLEATIQPQTGYPWRVRVRTRYRLAEDGLTQSVTATNESADAAPFGTGPHPYLYAGPGGLNSWSFTLPAEQVLAVTPDRLAPVSLEPVTVDAARFDFRQERVLGEVRIDHAYTGLTQSVVRLTDPSGSGVEMTWDDACAWVQIHTADKPGGPADPIHRAGLAVEPMTCAPDAFNDDAYPYDTGLVLLAPGAELAASWRIAAL